MEEKRAFSSSAGRGGPSYNSGFLEGRFKMSGQRGMFRFEEGGRICELEFLLSGDKAEIHYLNEKADCGFGQGVYANGIYGRTSRKAPAFSNGDPRVVQ